MKRKVSGKVGKIHNGWRSCVDTSMRPWGSRTIACEMPTKLCLLLGKSKDSLRLATLSYTRQWRWRSHAHQKVKSWYMWPPFPSKCWCHLLTVRDSDGDRFVSAAASQKTWEMLCSEPSRQQEYISHRWHTLPQLWRTATEVNIPLISFATSSDHHSQATWRNMLWSLFSRFDTSTGALVWNRKLSTHSSKLILYVTRLFKAQFVLSSCALGTTVNYSCKASCELWQLDQIRYRPRHPEEEKKSM